MLMGVTIPQQSMGVVIPSLFQEDELEHVRRVNRMQLMQLGTTNTRSHDIYELQQEILRENRPEIHIVSLFYRSCENLKSLNVNNTDTTAESACSHTRCSRTNYQNNNDT